MCLRLSFINHAFAAVVFTAAMASAHAAGTHLYEIDIPAAKLAPHRALDSRINFRLDAIQLSGLGEGETLELALPDQQIIRARVARRQVLIKGTTKRHTVLSFEGGRGSIELVYSGQSVSEVRITDVRNTPRVYKATLNSSGVGELLQLDAHEFYCIDMPSEAQASNQVSADPQTVSALTPDLAQLQSLQSKPYANKLIYLNYWGGTLSGTHWNDVYNNGLDIVYTPYSFDDDPTGFSDGDLERMWLGWRETVEDYAPFDVNVTTDQAVYDAMPSEDRSMVIATTSTDWFGSSAGGVADLNSFGNDYSGIAWAWNKGFEAFGQTMAHEAGHQMGLLHDGLDQSPFPDLEYYAGHGSRDEWGPIMGAPFGKTYVQWSRGEYDNANNQEDDLMIIRARLGEDLDVIGDTQGTAYELSSAAYIEGVIEPRGMLAGMDTDVYRFSLASTQDVEIQIAPVLADMELRFGSNLSLYARLTNGTQNIRESSQTLPFYPQNNSLIFDGPLAAGTYYLIITALSPNLSWDSGFGEYGNGGIYSVSLSSGVDEPDLITRLNVEDSSVYIGQQVRLSAQVQNIGTTIADASIVRFYQSTDQTISGTDTQVAMRNTLTLSPLVSDYVNEPVIVPGTPGTIYYGLCVDAVAGENAVLNNCSASTAFTIRDLSADLDIGEAVEQTSLNWLRGGDESFFRQTNDSINEGDAARSGAIGADEISYITTQISGPGWIRFNWKVSSEDTYDFFRFWVDGLEVDAISGEQDWAPVTYELGAGLYTLQWRYDKDPFTIEGQDAAWLDKVEFANKKFEIIAFDGPQEEGDGGVVEYMFSVSSTGISGAISSVDFTVSGIGPNPADADDFGGAFPSETIEFAPGQAQKNITISVSSDALAEADEAFSFTLSNPQGGVLGNVISVQSSILNDDDDDADGIANIIDNCPDDANPAQEDLDGDLKGDACDDDIDGDGKNNEEDNCPLDANPNQRDICTLCFPVKTAADSTVIICL